MNQKVKITAELVCFARAAGALEQDPAVRNPDYLAHELIRWRYRMALLPCIRPLMEKMYDRLVPGMYLYHQTRTRHIDSLVGLELAGTPAQFVILGAGLDSRAYRMRELLHATQVFEVDHPATADWKQRRLRRWGGHYRHVTFVPVDFTTESLAARLTASGFDFKLRTLFLLDGVAYYLTEATLRHTMAMLAQVAPDSGLGLDFIDVDAIDHPTRFPGAQEFLLYAKRRSEPILFGIAPGQVDTFLAQYGFDTISMAREPALQDRYLRLSDGTSRGHACDFFSIVHARKSTKG